MMDLRTEKVWILIHYSEVSLVSTRSAPVVSYVLIVISVSSSSSSPLRPIPAPSAFELLFSAPPESLPEPLPQSLRNLPHPGYFGSLDGSKLRDDIFWMPEPFPAIDSSFDTERELLNGILEKYLHDSGESAQHRVNFYRRVLPRILKGSGSPVFTHNDLRRKNVMITPENTVVILD